MKYSFLLIALFIVSCSNPVSPTNGNPPVVTDSLLFQKDSLVANNIYWFFISPSFNCDFHKIRISFNSITNSASGNLSISGWDSVHSPIVFFCLSGNEIIGSFNESFNLYDTIPYNLNLDFALGTLTGGFVKVFNIKAYKSN